MLAERDLECCSAVQEPPSPLPPAHRRRSCPQLPPTVLVLPHGLLSFSLPGSGASSELRWDLEANTTEKWRHKGPGAGCCRQSLGRRRDHRLWSVLPAHIHVLLTAVHDLQATCERRCWAVPWSP